MNTEKIRTIEELEEIKRNYNDEQAKYQYRVYVCAGAGCVSSGCGVVRDAVVSELERQGLTEKVHVYETGCMGTCAVGPVMLVLPDRVFYTELNEKKAREIVRAHLVHGNVIENYTFFDQSLGKHVPIIDDISFFRHQVKIALRNCGAIEYDDVRAYIANGGYASAYKVLKDMSPEQVVAEMKASGLKGRGGAGFPTGVKWEAAMKQQSDKKYIVCNADEGDPGAFMDRSIIEGDPHTVIEGMLIGGYTIGATTGYIYVRAEYPIAVERMTAALEEARQRGLLGKDIFGSGFDFDIEIRIGAGAFVCGEETALMASIEGQRGEPQQKPPFPFQSGLFGKPTIINNVETYANVPVILAKGGEWYAQYGTEKSKGTKVFALAGDVVNTGIVEVPIGIPLGEIIFNIGGGIPNKKKFKAAQIGGPSGGCVTAENLNVPTDYESIKALGAIMGSGGLIVMNEDTCMVDTARFFMDFIRDESCGKCTACRIGTKRMLEILERITRGEGEEGDVELLIELGETIQDTAMCGLGQTAPNPVLSTIKYFREEYDEHIRNKYCRAGVCSELFVSPCENTCPANVNVPGYMSLVAAGRFIDAYNLIRQENPFPAVCGRICTRPCERKCRRGQLDEALAICDLKRFVADYAMKNEKSYKRDIVFPKNGKSVSIVGAGASGLTCGYYLARLGYEVDLYESHSAAGGVLVYGIPEYRLPKDVLEHEVRLIEETGVRIHLNTEVGEDILFKDLRNHSDAIYIATGTQLPQKINIPGESLPGVIHGIKFLKLANTHQPTGIGDNVVVIGGGNTAIDSARTALRLGAKKVTIMYRRTIGLMPAYETEVHEAMEEGIDIIELAAPINLIMGADGRVAQIECLKMELGGFDASGRRQFVSASNSRFRVDADTVIPAVSQYADFPFIGRDEIGITRWGTFILQDNESQMTTMEGVFAGGDVTRGPDEVIRAIADGKRAAIAIDKYLGGKGKLNKGEPIDIPVITDEDEVIAHKRFPVDMLDPETRKGSFDEVSLGYHKLNAIAEAMRCLHCERR